MYKLLNIYQNEEHIRIKHRLNFRTRLPQQKQFFNLRIFNIKNFAEIFTIVCMKIIIFSNYTVIRIKDFSIYTE